MPFVRNNATSADAYSAANTLECPSTVRFVLQVNNAAIYLQRSGALGVAPGGETFMPEVLFVPGIYPFNRRTNRLRWRSAAAGVPAQVTIEALTEADLALGA